MDFTNSKIKEFYFRHTTFNKPFYLPKELDKLDLMKCESSNLLKAQKVNDIRLQGYNLEEHQELAQTLKGVKDVKIDDEIAKCLTSLPSSIRKICICKPWEKIENLEETAKYLPYLIEIKQSVPIEPLEETRLRMIEPIVKETKEKFKLRPRKITVNSENVYQLNNHPELFEKVEYAVIRASEFNFDVLSSEIKKIEIYKKVDEESISLNRFEKEHE